MVYPMNLSQMLSQGGVLPETPLVTKELAQAVVKANDSIVRVFRLLKVLLVLVHQEFIQGRKALIQGLRNHLIELPQ
jgi:hypothetical protein